MKRQILIVLSLAIAACKGETKTVPDPQTASDLDACRKSGAEKDKLIKAMQDEADVERKTQGSGGEITVVIEGNALTVKPGAQGAALPPVDPKVAAAASKEFLDLVAKSRGAIQKCYEQALKKNTGLQAKTVTMTVSASFGAAGAYKDSSFSPLIDSTFDTCMKTIAAKWFLPTTSPAMSFKAQVSLTPS